MPARHLAASVSHFKTSATDKSGVLLVKVKEKKWLATQAASPTWTRRNTTQTNK